MKTDQTRRRCGLFGGCLRELEPLSHEVKPPLRIVKCALRCHAVAIHTPLHVHVHLCWLLAYARSLPLLQAQLIAPGASSHVRV